MKTITNGDIEALRDPNGDEGLKQRALHLLALWERAKHRDLELLRGQAAITLLEYWHLGKYVDDAIAILENRAAEGFSDRQLAAHALGGFLRSQSSRDTKILCALARTAKSDPKWPVQQAAYEALLSVVSPDDVENVPDAFDTERDINSAIIAPFLQESGDVE